MKTRATFFIISMVFSLSSSASEQPKYTGISDEFPTGSKAISSDGLVAAYDFESFTPDGFLRDFSPYAHHGKLMHRETTQGRFGQALEFSSKNDVVLLPASHHFGLTGPLTVATQLKIVSADLHQHVFVCSDLFVLWLTTSNKYRFADTLGQGLTTTGKVDKVIGGEWHSVVAVFSAGKGDTLSKENIKIYVNGMQLEGQHEKAWLPTKLAGANACVIGGTRTGAQKHQDLQFEGIIDELQIFSRALSDDEIKAYSNHY